MKITIAFLKEQKREICLYIIFAGTFAVVSYLYDIRMDAVRYTCLLSMVWLVMSGILDYMRYIRKHKELLAMEQGIMLGFESMPDAAALIEKDYQKIIEKLDEARSEMESATRIGRQEMADYYGMWVHQIKTPIAAMHVLLQAFEEIQYGSAGRSNDDSRHGDEECQYSDTDQKISFSQAAAMRQYTKEMKLELFKIEQYVEMVLTYLRMEDMSSDLTFDIYSLDSIIRQTIRKYSQMFILKKIKLAYSPIEMKVLTDEKWLIFVLEQLLSNALKYTSSNGCISIYMKERYLVIEDTGIGIWPEDLPRVFEKGFTGYNGRTDKKSTGIGLYLCKSIIDKLHHQIWIESEAEKGTKVYLSLARKEIRHE